MGGVPARASAEGATLISEGDDVLAVGSGTLWIQHRGARVSKPGLARRRSKAVATAPSARNCASPDAQDGWPG